ncbi:uncharacterized protein ISCGN_024288 [Ixodes scapularis]
MGSVKPHAVPSRVQYGIHEPAGAVTQGPAHSVPLLPRTRLERTKSYKSELHALNGALVHWVEAQFQLHHITSQTTKYLHVVSSLPAELADELEDILAAPATSNQYDLLKAAILARKTPSERSRLQHLLNMEELGDQRPSQLLRRMRQLMGDVTTDADTSLLRELFLQRLPHSMVPILAAAEDMPLDQLANLADRVREYSAPTISATSRRSNRVASPPSRSTENNLETRLSRLEQAIQDLQLSRRPRRISQDEPKHKVPVRDPTKHSAEVIEHQNYKRLCRGELLRSPKMDSQLRCRYYKGQDGFFALQPVKLEEVNLKPYIIVMHNVVQDRDIKDMIAFAEPRLQRSMTYTIDKVPSPVRTSSQWGGFRQSLRCSNKAGRAHHEQVEVDFPRGNNRGGLRPRDEVQRALQPETPVNEQAPEEPRLTYAAMARRPPQASRQATVPPRRQPPAPQYYQRREERQYVRPEKPAPRKTDVWRTDDGRPVCFHCGEADHVYRRCPYRQLGLRGFAPNDRRPRFGERPRDIEECLRRPPSPAPTAPRGSRSPSPRRSASPFRRSRRDSLSPLSRREN